MLVFDFRSIGNKLLAIRKSKGLTQADVAEASGISDRTYADIERGTVNMRMETCLKICRTLQITPNEILTEEPSTDPIDIELMVDRLDECSLKERLTAWQLMLTYLDSLK